MFAEIHLFYKIINNLTTITSQKITEKISRTKGTNGCSTI